MRNIRPKILPTDNIKPIPKPIIQLSLDNPSNLAILLRLSNAPEISHFFNRSISNADDRALVLGAHIGESD